MPPVGVQKTLHQRNKSSPALSSMLHQGGLKAAAKRTAFGDVSNISNTTRPSKDDSIIGAKASYAIAEKPVALQHDKKATSFLRPAQRPLSVSGLKNLLNNVTNSSTQNTSKQPLAEISETAKPTSQIANIRKVLTKRNTSVFKDGSHIPVEQATSDLDKPVSTTIPPGSLHPDPDHPQELVVTEELKELPEEVRPPVSQCHVQPERCEDNKGSSSLSESSEFAPAVRSDGVLIDSKNESQLIHYSSEQDQEQPEPASVDDDGVATHAADILTQVEVTTLDKILDSQFEVLPSEPIQSHRLTSVSEPEEYWDDEEEEENYDEEGYVTARSYKSRGENTTNGATTILFPKVNQKVKREIAAAKDMMENTKFAEELDDESWDTTMVAEYGEEIFQYMKDLEVHILFIQASVR